MNKTIKTLIKFIGASFTAASILTSSVSANFESSNVNVKPADIQIRKSANIADSFIENYYLSIFGDEKINVESCDQGLSDYLSVKTDWLKSSFEEKENIAIKTTLMDSEITSSTVKLAVFVEVKFNEGESNESGMGRTVQIVLENSVNPRVLDVYINDNVDDCLRPEANIMSSSYKGDFWSVNAEAASKVMKDIAKASEESKEFVSQELNQANLLSVNSSSVSSSQRDKIALYAKNYCGVQSPPSGNPSLIANYCDFSGISNTSFDCTNFASHCLLAGGAKFNETSSVKWYYKDIDHRTTSWSDVNYFYNFAVNNTGDGPQADEYSLTVNCPMSYMTCEKGDFIQIDKERDGSFNHTVIVTSFKTNQANYSYTPKVTGRSGAESGLDQWYDLDRPITEKYPLSANKFRVLHFTTLG